jgi:putative ABC transport system permease protein
MIKNHFKTAWRNMKSNRLFTILNISGLAIGICVCILLFTYISNELSFDKMYQNSENIYRVNLETSAEYNNEKWAQLPNAVGPAMLQDIRQVKAMTRLIKDDFGATASLKIGDKNFTENGLYLADSAVFKMFDFNFLEGDMKTAFKLPNSIVLSQTAKERFFGNGQAIGKLIYVNSRDTLQVTGVYQNLPKNSVIDCDMIYHIMDTWMGTKVYWSNASYETYVQLQPNANVAKVQTSATKLIDKYVEKDGQYFTKFMLQPLQKIHLYSADIRNGYTTKLGSISSVKSFLILSLLVLLIACINYMNLATANSQKRSKGIGMKKVLGAKTSQMIALFYIETGILTFISIIIGFGLSFIAIPFFQRITGMALSYQDLLAGTILISLLAIWLTVTLIAGSYPAISMSGISPMVLISKAKIKLGFSEWVRKGLVVFQFASSIILIISVSIILKQMSYIRNKNLGYNPEGVVSVSIKSVKSREQLNRLLSDLKSLNHLEGVSAVQSIPGDRESGRSVRKLTTDKEGLPIKSCRTNGSIIKTMKLELLAGSDLPENIAEGDSIAYTLINETVAKYLGFKTPQDAVGKYINSELADVSVVSGVVKNFNYHSVKDEIGGYMYYTMKGAPEPLRSVMIRYQTNDLPKMISEVEGVFSKDLPDAAFDYRFLDEYVANLYKSEQHTADTASVFSILAIFIACLGLFGLATFTAEQRKKEIGIRKVLGASVSGVTNLLTKDFLKLVFIAFIIAAPAAWWLMNKWLADFAYKTEISLWIFLLAGILSVLVAYVTISLQTVKAALANPIKSLRTE